MTDLRLLEVDYATPPTDGQGLQYSSSSGLWTPKDRTIHNTWTTGPTGAGTGGPMGTTNLTGSCTEYIDEGEYVALFLSMTFETTGTGSSEVTFALPFAPHADWQGSPPAIAPGMIIDGAGYTPGVFYFLGDVLHVAKVGGGNWGIGAGRRVAINNVRYRKA